MRRAAYAFAVLAALVASPSCGPGPSADGQMSFGVYVDRAAPDRVGSLQVAILSHGSNYDCAQVEKSCLQSQLDRPSEQLVSLPGSDGKQHSAVRFAVSLADGGTQSISVPGIPVGKDFAVVVEALTKDNPPSLYGSSCNFVREIVAGANPQLIATIRPIASPDGGTDAGFRACDPRFEP